MHPTGKVEEGSRGAVKSVRWATPWPEYNALDAIFHFVVDLAADEENAKHEVHITEEINCLTEDWTHWMDPGEAGFLNPPYGQEVKPKPEKGVIGNVGVSAFLCKSFYEVQKGITVVVLVHAKTETQWWIDWAERSTEQWFVKGRIPFIDPLTGKPGRGGPSVGQAILIYDENSGKAPPVRKWVNRKMQEVGPRPLTEAERDWWGVHTMRSISGRLGQL